MNIFKIIKYQLYLLQLENYELDRYFKLLLKKGFLPQPDQRKDLVWTSKALLILGIAIFLHLGVTLVMILKHRVLAALLWFVFLATCYFLFYLVAAIILYPVDWLLKMFVIYQAKNKLKTFNPQLKVIGIAGSYGKTTMKEVLVRVLNIKYKVLSTPDSVNTPVGIAQWILNKVTQDTQILIVEMGEHYKGDVEYLCKMLPPDVGVITGINESHAERMGSLENVAETILEMDKNLKKGASLIVNIDDKYIFEHRSAITFKFVSYYGVNHQEFNGFYFQNLKFDPEKLCWQVNIPAANINLEMPLLGEYAAGLVVAAIQVATSFDIPVESLNNSLAKIKPVEHRLQPIAGAGGVLIIDDAYNGNPEGVAEAIKVLSRFPKRRKVFITPGLVEMGSAAANIHREIGKQLAGVADIVVLIKNSVTPWIEEGMKLANLQGSQSVVQPIWFNTAQEAHANLGNILKANDVVVFQNDWGDQYL